jgi:hypothetical protein
MFVAFTPRDADRQTWDFVPDDVLQSEAELIEKFYAASFDEFLNGVRAGVSRARKVLLFHLMRQTHPTYKFRDVPDYRVGELKVEFSAAELVEIRDRFDRMDTDGDEEASTAFRARLEVELTDAILREHGDATVAVDDDPAPPPPTDGDPVPVDEPVAAVEPGKA